MAQPHTTKKDSDNNTKQPQTKKNSFIHGVLLCFIFGMVLFMLCAFVLFKVNTIKIEGLQDEFCNGTHKFTNSCYYSDDEIIKVCGVDTGESLVLLSAKDIRSSVTKLLPYIGSVEVKRQYPSTLKIIVSDTHAEYAVDAGGGYTLLDKNFKALERCDKVPENCAEIVGVHLRSAELGKTVQFEDESCKQRISAIEENCEKRNLAPVTKIDIVNIANISLKIDDKYTIVLGMLADLDEKFDSAADTIKAEIKKNPDSKKIINVVDPKRAYVGDDKTPDKSDDNLIAVG